MAHKLHVENGRASMMYVGEEAWHGLGRRGAGRAAKADRRGRGGTISCARGHAAAAGADRRLGSFEIGAARPPVEDIDRKSARDSIRATRTRGT